LAACRLQRDQEQATESVKSRERRARRSGSALRHAHAPARL